MKNMKKVLALLLCAGMVFAFAACGGNDADEKGSGTDASAVSGAASDNGIYLPEDGKITFGKDNQTDDPTESDTARDEEPGETAAPSETDETTETGGDSEYGGIKWNK